MNTPQTPGEWRACQRRSKRWVVVAVGQLGGKGSVSKIEAAWPIAVIQNGKPGDTLDTEAANARLFAAAKDHALFASALVRGLIRWEQFSADSAAGELCCNGLRYATRLDEFGLPILNRNTREAIFKAGGSTCFT